MDRKDKILCVLLVIGFFLIGLIIGFIVGAQSMLDIIYNSLDHLRIEQFTVGFNETKMVELMLEQVNATI